MCVGISQAEEGSGGGLEWYVQFREGILWLSVGEEEGGDRNIGGQIARRAFISTEDTQIQRGVHTARGKLKGKFEERKVP